MNACNRGRLGLLGVRLGDDLLRNLRTVGLKVL